MRSQFLIHHPRTASDLIMMIPTLLALSLTFLLIQVPNALGDSISFTPPQSFIQCQPAKLFWSSTGPIFIGILPASQSNAFASPNENPGSVTPIADFGEQTGSSVTWNAVNVTAGTSIVVALRDETGNSRVTSGSVTVSGGDDNSCLVSDSGTGADEIMSTYPREFLADDVVDTTRYLELDIGFSIGSVYDILNRPRRYALSFIYL